MRHVSFLAALGLPLLLAACANGNPGTGAWQDGVQLSENSSLNHPIRVEPSLRLVPLDTDQHGALVADREQLGGIVADYARHGRGPMEVRGAPGAVRTALRGLLASGMRAGDLAPHIERGPGVVVSFPTARAMAPACGQFQLDLHRFGPLNPANSPTSDWGCASQHNLATMVADPGDLQHPRGAAPATQSGYLAGRIRDTQTYVAPPLPLAGSAAR